MAAETSERNSVVLDIEELAVSLRREIASLTGEIEKSRRVYYEEFQQRIPKVSPNLRNQGDGAYDPKYISIGPLHRDSKALMPIEQCPKQRYAGKFLDRILFRDMQETVCVCVQAVFRREKEARNCYPEDVTAALTAPELVSILVLDGCFLIEYMKEYVNGDLTGSAYLLRDDLLLLENQIPFFVLETLYEVAISRILHPLPSLHELAGEFIRGRSSPNHGRRWTTTKSREKVDYHHLLHLSHAYHADLPFVEGLPRKQRTGDDVDGADEAHKTFPYAWELLELGICVKKKTNRISPFGVSLKSSVLLIPPLTIDKGTITHFLNMVAFEQQSADAAGTVNTDQHGNVHTKHIFTDYAVLMSFIMRTNSDLELLEKRGILQRDPSVSREKVIEVFSNIREHAKFNYRENFFADLFRNIKVLTTSSWRRRKANMIRDLRKTLPGFMENPFVMIPLLVAGIYLGLTGIQTFVTVLNYIHPRSPN